VGLAGSDISCGVNGAEFMELRIEDAGAGGLGQSSQFFKGGFLRRFFALASIDPHQEGLFGAVNGIW
jgi:hypothetical protein